MTRASGPLLPRSKGQVNARSDRQNANLVQMLRPDNSIDTFKAAVQRTEFAGRMWVYSYQQIPATLPEAAVKAVNQRLLSRYAKLTKSWTDDQNSIWILRLFMAAKLVMMATLQANSLRFAGDVNLRVAGPHLRYYALLSLARAVCLTLPEIDWAGGKVFTMTHERAIRETVHYIQSFDMKSAAAVNSLVRGAKAQREFIDYRAPSSGDTGLEPMHQFEPYCRLLAELAQMNSELLDVSFEKHASDGVFSIRESYVQEFASIEIEGEQFIDYEDARRLLYLMRKHPRPTSIKALLTDGHVEDFFGAWIGQSENEPNFNPDDNLGVIFDV